MSTRRSSFVALAFLSAAYPAYTLAGPITSGAITPSSTPHTAAASPITFIVDNNPVPPPAISPNTVSIAKTFVAAPPPPPFLDIFFSVAITGGTTEYVYTETVTNSTGVAWSSYSMILGFGEGPGFIKSTPGDTLDFDVPDGPFPPFVSSAFATATLIDEDEILWSGGTVPPGGVVSFVFPVDAFDGGFTLREFPIVPAGGVPEPGSLVLLLGGLLGLCVARLRAQATRPLTRSDYSASRPGALAIDDQRSGNNAGAGPFGRP